jgi:hypothetical protein
MSRVKIRRLSVTASTSADVVAYNWYVSAPSDATFLADVDAGTPSPFDVTVAPEAFLDEGTLPEGVYQFAVVAEDGAGNTSDPYQAPAWVSVPLDLIPPAAPTDGVFE